MPGSVAAPAQPPSRCTMQQQTQMTPTHSGALYTLSGGPCWREAMRAELGGGCLGQVAAIAASARAAALRRHASGPAADA